MPVNILPLATGPNPVLPHPVEIVLALVVFAILYWLVKKYVVPNFEKTFAERTSAIEGGLAAIGDALLSVKTPSAGTYGSTGRTDDGSHRAVTLDGAL